MTPLDLTSAPPRSPREKVRGLCMLPRMIDIARAKLPGGEIGEYQIGRGMSAVVLGAFGVSVPEFVDLVRSAGTDDDVAERLWPSATMRLEALGAGLRRITVARVPPELRPDFERFYGADIPADRRLFDILEEDDARAFPNHDPKLADS